MRILHLLLSVSGRDLEKTMAARFPRAVLTLTWDDAIKAMKSGHSNVAFGGLTGQGMGLDGQAVGLGYVVKKVSVP